jgi:hypothetical protein
MSNQNKNFQSIAIFVAAAALSLISLTPTPSAAVGARTVAGRGACINETAQYSCAGVAGDDFLISQIDNVFLNFSTGQSMTVLLTVARQSFTGEVAADTRTRSYGSGLAFRDELINPVNVRNGATEFDYLYSRIRNQTGATGVTSITPVGITYEDL